MYPVIVIYTNAETEVWDVRSNLADAQVLGKLLTTDPEYPRVAEASVMVPEDDLTAPSVDTPEWWATCHFMRPGAVVEREW